MIKELRNFHMLYDEARKKYFTMLKLSDILIVSRSVENNHRICYTAN